MNLTVVRELLALYKLDPNTQNFIDGTKLLAVCDKIKMKGPSEAKNSRVTSAKMNNSQLASACWNLLVQINRHTSSSFSSPTTFFQTAKVVLSCAKIIESVQGEFKMGPLDLEKIVANIIAKLSEGLRLPVNSTDEQAVFIINLMEFFFERLQKHFNSLESGMRRMSLVELPSADDPFIDVDFRGICPEMTKDPTLIQLATVSLESLCRITLIFQKGPIESILDVLRPFHQAINADNQIAHFISSICKLDFWSEIEWKFWNSISGHEIYKNHLVYFKKRCHLKLSPPTITCDKLCLKIVAMVLTTGQLTNEMIDTIISENENVDEIIGPCLGLLLKEGNQVYFSRIESVLRLIPSNPVSETALRTILSSLDALRNGLFHMIRDDAFISLLSALNECLLRIDFPVKFYVSWTSQVLKAVIEYKKYSNQVKELVKRSIKGLLERENIPAEMKPKVYKIISQSLSIAADTQLLQQFLSTNDDRLETVLEASNFNLPQEYFNALSAAVLSVNPSESILVLWIKTLSSQVAVTSKAFECANGMQLHLLAKFVSNIVFDQVKLDNYLELIYSQLQKSGYSQDSISLSKQLLAFKNPKIFSSILKNYTFSDQSLQSAVQSLKNYYETGVLNVSSSDFVNLQISDDIEEELYLHFLNLVFVRASEVEFAGISLKFKGFDRIYNRMMHLLQILDDTHVSDTDFWGNVIEGTKLSELHKLYQNDNSVDAMKLGYENLKSSLKSAAIGIDKVLDAIEMIIYLHRLSVSANNHSEARYFLKQLFQLADTLKSENVKQLAHSLQKEFLRLSGDSANFIDYFMCEKILMSSAYKPFYFQYDNLVQLNRIRQEIKMNFQAPTSQYSIACNGIKVNSCKGSRYYQIINENISKSLEKLKAAQDRKLSYCTSEWAKLSLFFMFHKSFHECCDSEILNLFELGRNPNSRNVSVKELKGSIGLLHDQFLSILWILVVTLDAKLLLFKVNLDKSAVSRKIQRIHEICAQNTDSLRNTDEIAKDAEKKTQWWKLRKSLDSELISLCSDLDEDLFSSVSELIIPSSNNSMTARNIHNQLNELMDKLSGGSIYITEALSGQLVIWEQFPKRFKIEKFIEMYRFSLNLSNQGDKFSSEEMDSIISKIRKCFENSFDLGIPSVPLLTSNAPFNLCIDKDLNIIPFESFPAFNKFTLKRIPVIYSNNIDSSSTVFEKVFYVVNPSGDLVQTQERFEKLFQGQPNWNGVIGRKPTTEEFFNGIRGIYDLFIYFGHSSGEIYAPLKELKSKLAKRASSALLIGCSSGRIKSNGIFPAESSIFHYLENGSPLILANLWDVTDKDIDLYIKGVLEDSDLLLPIGSERITIQSTANYMTIIEKAQMGRQRCMLKALNGFAPIVYGLI